MERAATLDEGALIAATSCGVAGNAIAIFTARYWLPLELLTSERCQQLKMSAEEVALSAAAQHHLNQNFRNGMWVGPGEWC